MEPGEGRSTNHGRPLVGGAEISASLEAATKYMQANGLRGGWTSAVVVERAWALGLRVRPGRGGRVMLSDGVRSGWFRGGRTNLNHLLAMRCARHKDVTSALLRASGSFAPRNLKFHPGDNAWAWAWAESALPVVVKPPAGAHGASVHVGVYEQSDFMHAFDEVSRHSGSVLVEEYAPGVEHRVLTVGGKVVAATRRVPAYVVGDGISNVQALIDRRSRERIASGNPLHRGIKVDSSVLRRLSKMGLSLQSIPKKGDVVSLRAASNTHFGGDAVDATDSITAEEVRFVEHAAKVFKGLRLAGFDVLLPRDGIGQYPSIVEVNANPAIALHHFPIEGKPRDVAGSLLKLMFPTT